MMKSGNPPEAASPEALVFERSRFLDASPQTVYQWHARPGAFARLSPPWEKVELVHHTGGVADGARVRLRLRAAGLAVTWDLEHTDHEPGRQFCDRQTSGPFRSWHHLHRFEPTGEQGTRLTDRLTIQLPFGRIGRIFGRRFLTRQLRRLFQYRHDVTASDVNLLVERQNQNKPALRILVTGASGLIGRQLVPFLRTQGHEVVTLGRSPDPEESTAYRWDPERGEIDLAAFSGVDAVVHLAGANLAEGRWTRARKQAIRDSRINATRLLVESMSGLDGRVAAFVSSSAIGFYGDTGDEAVTETGRNGRGFLADLCRDWEAEAMKATQAGIRVVLMRTGVVLTPEGGALGALLPIFRKGAGGPVGKGAQWMSWISSDDLCAAFLHVLENESLNGPCNGVAPEPIRNEDFTRTLATVLHRPAVVPAPATMLRLLFGQMADETLLVSCRVLPGALESSGFSFRHPNLEEALRHLLGRKEEGIHE